MQIKDRENSPDLRARAAAELGEILGWQVDKHIRNAVEDEKRRLGLTAAQCFDEAIRLAENSSAVLVSAGKYFRQQKNVTKFRELLQKAVDLRSEPKAHHQLGITLGSWHCRKGVRDTQALTKGIAETNAPTPVPREVKGTGVSRDSTRKQRQRLLGHPDLERTEDTCRKP